MLPVFALVGRPNVGKSTLFNRLTRSRDAIVDDQPGVTRDRLYGRGNCEDAEFLVVDTGGLESAHGAFGQDESAHDELKTAIRQQVELAVAEADAVLFIVDAKHGLVSQDREIADRLRTSRAAIHANIYVLVNKSEGVATEVATAEFQALGLGAPFAISAKRGDGVTAMLPRVLGDGLIANAAADAQPEPSPADEDTPVFALAGRPNAGKSTLANQLLGANRVLVSDQPGTTRDSVRLSLQTNGREIALIDTAGVRRKARVSDGVEKFSVIKALQAVQQANVVLLMLDAQREVGFQDASIANIIRDLGRSMVVLVNKWDKLAHRQRSKIKLEIARKLPFLPNPEILFISALHGSNLDKVVPAALRAYQSAMRSVATSHLTRTLQRAVTQTPPPMHRGRAVRLKFAHQAGKNPPVVVIHGSQATKIPGPYRRYLANFFGNAYRLRGTPVRIIFRAAQNPYVAPKPAHKSRSTRQRR